jgi:hypothetical protein
MPDDDSLMNALHPGASGSFSLKGLVELPFPTQWRPRKKGSTIAGRCVYLRNELYYADQAPVLYLEKPDGSMARVVATFQIKKEIREQNIRPGQLVAISFDGKKRLDDGKTMNLNTVVTGEFPA